MKKEYLITAVIAIVAIAIVNRVAQLKALLNG